MNRQQTLQISGWYTPPAEEPIFRLIAEAGFNAVFLQGDHIGNNCRDEALLDRYLRLCDEFGLKALVQVGEVSMQEAEPVLRRLKAHPSYAGALVFDEPPADRFAQLCRTYADFFREGRLGAFFVNLFPSYARSECIIHDYAAYVRSFAESLAGSGARGEWMSFDHYPLIYGEQGEPALSERWLDDLRTVAEVGKAFGMPKNAFIQAMPFSNMEKRYGSRDRIPGFAELSLQVYASLAFGFCGLSYFCLGTPHENFEFLEKHFALFDRKGAPTPIYGAAKTLNAEISAFGSELCALAWEKAFLPGEPPRSRLADAEADPGLLCGLFRGEDGEGWILLNFGEPSAEKRKRVRFRARGGLSGRLWQGGVCTPFGNGGEIELEPGRGAFLLLNGG